MKIRTLFLTGAVTLATGLATFGAMGPAAAQGSAAATRAIQQETRGYPAAERCRELAARADTKCVGRIRDMLVDERRCQSRHPGDYGWSGRNVYMCISSSSGLKHWRRL